MPEIVTCPNCSRKLRVPDNLLGKTVKCPECKQAFSAQTESAPTENGQADEPPPPPSKSSDARVSTNRRTDADAEERMPMPPLRRSADDDEDHPSYGGDDFDNDDDRDRADKRAVVTSGWQSVRLGLNLFIYGIYISVGAFFLGLLGIGCGAITAVIGGATAAGALFGNNPNSSGAAAGGGGAIFIVAIVVAFSSYGLMILGQFAKWVMQTIGHVFFLWIPDRTGAGRRPLAIASLSLWAAQLILTIGSWMLICLGNGLRNQASGGLGLGANCFSLISMLCDLAWFFVFMFFLRSIALAMRNDGLARTLVIFMIVVPVFAVLAVVGFIGVVCLGGLTAAGLASNANSAGGGAAIGTGWMILVFGVMILIFVIWLALWIWYVVLLHQVRGSVSQRLGELTARTG